MLPLMCRALPFIHGGSSWYDALNPLICTRCLDMYVKRNAYDGAAVLVAPESYLCSSPLTLVVNLGRAAHVLLQPLLASLKQDPPRVTDLRRQAELSLLVWKKTEVIVGSLAGKHGIWRQRFHRLLALLVLDKLPPYPYTRKRIFHGVFMRG